MDSIIEVNKLYKKYLIGNRQPYLTLRDTLTSVVGNWFGKGPSLEKNEFWALKDVSFNVRPGEILGIIGRNGAGKSTILKIISRITYPTKGEIKIRGKVASLLEIGTGFSPELSGRENIFLNGAILGMSQKEIKRKFDEIVAFSEIGKFLETPVKRYSSGMYMRLAFAVAAHLDTDILLVDEVLAVGDMEFQKKCLNKMDEVTKTKGRTIIFVSHNMQALSTLCTRGLLLSNGKVVCDTSIEKAIEKYRSMIRRKEFKAEAEIGNENNRRGSGDARFTKIEVKNIVGKKIFRFEAGEKIVFSFTYKTNLAIKDLYLAISLRSARSGEPITTCRFPLSKASLKKGTVSSASIEIPGEVLRIGEYTLYFWLGNSLMQPFDIVDDLLPPLEIYSYKGMEQLGYNPDDVSGYINIPAQLVIQGK